MGSYSGSREIEIELYRVDGQGWCRADDDEAIPAALSRLTVWSGEWVGQTATTKTT